MLKEEPIYLQFILLDVFPLSLPHCVCTSVAIRTHFLFSFWHVDNI